MLYKYTMSINIKDLKLETCLIFMNKLKKPDTMTSGYMVYSNHNFLTYDIHLTHDLLKLLMNQELKDDEYMIYNIRLV